MRLAVSFAVCVLGCGCLPWAMAHLAAVKERLHRFAQEFNTHGKPFNWHYTRRDLQETLDRFSASVLTRDGQRAYRETG